MRMGVLSWKFGESERPFLEGVEEKHLQEKPWIC